MARQPVLKTGFPSSLPRYTRLRTVCHGLSLQLCAATLDDCINRSKSLVNTAGTGLPYCRVEPITLYHALIDLKVWYIKVQQSERTEQASSAARKMKTRATELQSHMHPVHELNTTQLCRDRKRNKRCDFI